MPKFHIAKTCFLTVAALTAAAGSASAIQCDEDYQIVEGQPVSTPYCRDNNLAAVARSYGYKVSDAAVRNNPERKEEVCRFIGGDIRVQQACAEVLPGARDNR
ncbi:hypothetical protein [Hyphomicrobium sp.]|uniref:hypothetical protein n=1 Tax=Hyphomicrobium sp. TaxID=82 RepID=UPI002D79CAF7|nr:hypothetical protein [Hyphomicrobium sp.]HET6388308.1 hypothetical protein [Hyphomicrobium sp.]